MAAINGTALLLYSDGQVIALQKGVSITVDTDLPDATNKESAGWAQHIQGQLNAKIDFSALFSTEVTAGMGANALMNYIINRQSLLISILGLSFPMVAEVDLNSLSFDAPNEGAMSLSGSLKVKGQLYCLRATSASLLTDLNDGGDDYDTFTVSGNHITAAIDAGGGAYDLTNQFAVVSGATYKLACFVSLASGEYPSVRIDPNGSTPKSNAVQLANGLNIVSLIATDTGDYRLHIYNTAATAYEIISMYLFRV